MAGPETLYCVSNFYIRRKICVQILLPIVLTGLLIFIPNAGETAPYYATSFTEIMFHVSTRSVPCVNKIKY
jgi:hypothetical protein